MPLVFYSNVEEIQKDSREKLRYSFSIHHLDDTGNGFISPH
jgi:Ca2+-binding EF-hand superfamily protein